MKCKCGGPDPSGPVHKYCEACAELLAKVYLLWDKSTFKGNLQFSEFFRKMMDSGTTNDVV